MLRELGIGRPAKQSSIWRLYYGNGRITSVRRVVAKVTVRRLVDSENGPSTVVHELREGDDFYLDNTLDVNAAGAVQTKMKTMEIHVEALEDDS
jgi:hypothetical protein